MRRSTGADAATFSAALQGCLEACRRCEVIVRGMTGDADPAGEVYQAVGPHLRHCLDHFECLLRGLDQGCVDYDARQRRSELERDPEMFLTEIASVAERLRRIEPRCASDPLRLRQEAAPGDTAEVTSSLERELIFLSGHTIHHIAIVRLLAEARGFTFPSGVDVAYSTATFQTRSARNMVTAGS